MSLSSLPSSRPSLPARSGRLATSAGLLRRLGSRLLAFYLAWEDRRSVARLYEVDDRMLADIGLTRGDIDGAMSLGAIDRPSSHLVAAAEERRRARSLMALAERNLR